MEWFNHDKMHILVDDVAFPKINQDGIVRWSEADILSRVDQERKGVFFCIFTYNDIPRIEVKMDESQFALKKLQQDGQLDEDVQEEGKDAME